METPMSEPTKDAVNGSPAGDGTPGGRPRASLWYLLAVVAILLVAIAGAALARARSTGSDVTRRGPQLAGSSETSPSKVSTAGGASSDVVTDTAAKTTTDPDAQGDDAGTSSGEEPSTGSGAAQGAAPGASTPASRPANTSANAETMKFLVIYWNDAVEDPLPQLTLGVRGSSQWKPGTGARVTHTFGPVPLDKLLFLDVYPEGPSGEKYPTEIRFDDQMIPNSEQDAVHVQVTDGAVRVLGNPVDNFQRTFER